MRPGALACVGLAFVLAGCSTVQGDIAIACELGLTTIHDRVTEQEIVACASTDEAVLKGMADADRTEAEDCIACVARKGLHEVLCFSVCEAGTCTLYGLGACESACSGPGMVELCARGGMPAQTTDLR